MKPVLSREQVRAFDQDLMTRCRVPGVVLMENAGRAAAEATLALASELGAPSSAPVLVVCGIGNNGGDGFVVARRLRALARPVEVLLLGEAERVRGDARTQLDAWLGIGGSVTPLGTDLQPLDAALTRCSLVVDAVFGTGLDRAVKGPFLEAIELINRHAKPVLALDVPSGIDADCGVILGAAVRALVTVTFAALKPGLLCARGIECAGRVVVADIGVPFVLAGRAVERARLVEAADVAQLLPSRPLTLHKGRAGRVLVVAGSPGKTGAARLAARAALRAGAGLVTIATRSSALATIRAASLEDMVIDAEDAQALGDALAAADVVVVGPGLGIDSTAADLLEAVLRWNGRKVLDADALTLLAGRRDVEPYLEGKALLTPHPGEAARLLGITSAEVEANRLGALDRCVALTGATVLLKGPRTLIGAPGAVPVFNSSGNPLLATGGSGDVLAGLAAALAVDCQLPEAAVAAAWLHGRAAELYAARTGADRGLLAHEVADLLPEARAGLRSARG